MKEQQEIFNQFKVCCLCDTEGTVTLHRDYEETVKDMTYWFACVACKGVWTSPELTAFNRHVLMAQ